MLNLKHKNSVRFKFAELNILTVYNCYILETISITLRLGIQTMVSHDYGTRNRLSVEKHHLEFFKKKISYMGSKLLKFIPAKIKNINDEKKFKKTLKEYLVSNPVYSIEEFYNQDTSEC